MSRVMYLNHQCSVMEKRLLKALRAFGWLDAWPSQAGFLLEEIGVSPEHTFLFARLIKGLMMAAPDFELLGPDSQFVSRDELNMMVALGGVTRNKPGFSDDPNPFQPVAFGGLLEACGSALREDGIILKTRSTLIPASNIPDYEESIQPLRKQAPLVTARVKAVESLSPLVRKVVLSGRGVKPYKALQPAQWVKIFLPTEKPRAEGRAFTIQSHGSMGDELCFEVALHPGGVMSQWVQQAKAGDEVHLSSVRGGLWPLDPSKWLLLAGDETALPAIKSILKSLPDDMLAYVFVEVENPGERQVLPISERVLVQWVYRSAEPSGAPEGLLGAMSSTPFPHTSGHAWLAGEASMVRALRQRLLRERSIGVGGIQAAGYWKIGEVDHRDLAVG
ncbi:siderophore-interacting protein [Pseudomonas sichuanensis]|uniref:siderophore-interacting protein n=1 Tax=Pseudomonas sichuanensis TaxID=2213015 RepID=UPI00244B466F|nr:siderophore-interacting protein [Pseudomonas sichuanensis]MDH0730158.1 siderophore-interacting protein [Pseudomonas sichuanensis]MDH1581258.1 siderophore-interacting protein [Pseudomonas sichuanensis]MDH1593419.1 siderophore-interacting protein [Pseudomonas sichuanensis]MDH1597174.1 siderophore-interacting protein [Pseudomonas sichuanensis]